MHTDFKRTGVMLTEIKIKVCLELSILYLLRLVDLCRLECLQFKAAGSHIGFLKVFQITWPQGFISETSRTGSQGCFIRF